MNLLACTVPRFLRRFGRSAPSAFAPDLIHLGLAVLIAAALATFALREERAFSLGIGERAEFRGTELVLRSATELRSSDGTLTGWRIDIEVLSDSGNAAAGTSSDYTIELNRPARIAGSRYYLQDYAAVGRITLRDTDGESYALETGQGFIGSDGRAYYLSALELAGNGAEVESESSDSTRSSDGNEATPPASRGRPIAVFTVAPSADVDPTERGVRVQAALGDRVDVYTYTGGERSVVVRLSASYNPGRIPTFAGLLILALGLGMYLLRLWRQHG